MAAVLVLAACGPRSSASVPSNATADPLALPASLERECFLGEGHCVVELDLDADGGKDRVEAVRSAPCDPPAAADGDDAEGDDAADDGEPVDPPCAQGLWITLATGATQQVGAGLALPAQPSPDENIEPIALDADLGGLRLLALSERETPGRIRWNDRMTAPAPCDGDGLVLSGSDAAAVLCWVGNTAAAYHLGF